MYSSDVDGEGALVATIQKKTNHRRDVSLDLNLGNGDYLSLNDPTGIGSEKKEEAIGQLEDLQAHLGNLINSLKNG